ncbi:MAG: radical SAM family heme chaperone HemW [Flavobacteriales bacterium]|nr:radical SAM family heme chaperone HemW [Flavobacteriales bacterium]
MAGIYIHIPFCRRACHYCDFHFTTNLSNADQLVAAIVKEIEIQKNYLYGETISTIYFGGGTPSLLPTKQIERIIQTIGTFHSVENDLELTLEANPEDLSLEKLKDLKSIGINRLSLGTQSFIDAELKWMNRMHTAEQAIECIKVAQQIGFDNISIDLIFGLPSQSVKDWNFNLATALSLNVQHISSYGLTIEAKTVLGNRVKKGTQEAPDDEVAAEFFRMNMEFFPSNGFEHYEISNFAKEGFISRHNSSYWRGVPYLGLGPSAHSFNGTSRQWNVRSNAAYLNSISTEKTFFKTEELSEIDRLNEQIMIGLRTKWGVEKAKMEQIRSDSWKILVSEVARQEPENYIVDESTIRLSEIGKLFSDKLTSDLFFD